MNRLDFISYVLISVIYTGSFLNSSVYASSDTTNPDAPSSLVRNEAEIAAPSYQAPNPVSAPASVVPPVPAQEDLQDRAARDQEAERQREYRIARTDREYQIMRLRFMRRHNIFNLVTNTTMTVLGVGILTAGAALSNSGLMATGGGIAGIAGGTLILTGRRQLENYRNITRLLQDQDQRQASAQRVEEVPWDENPSLHLKMSENDSKKDTENNHHCSICLEDFETVGENGRGVRIQCSHPFHEKCIKTWYEQRGTCPLCVAEIKKMTPEEKRAVFLKAEIEANQRNLDSIRAISDRTTRPSVSTDSDSGRNDVRIDIHSPLPEDQNGQAFSAQ